MRYCSGENQNFSIVAREPRLRLRWNSTYPPQPWLAAILSPGVMRLTGSTLSCRLICLRAWTYLPWTSSVR